MCTGEEAGRWSQLHLNPGSVCLARACLLICTCLALATIEENARHPLLHHLFESRPEGGSDWGSQDCTPQRQEWGKLTSNPYASDFQSGVPWEPPRASDKSGYLAQQTALHGTRADSLHDIHKDSCGSKRGDLSVYATGKPSGK